MTSCLISYSVDGFHALKINSSLFYPPQAFIVVIVIWNWFFSCEKFSIVGINLDTFCVAESCFFCIPDSNCYYTNHCMLWIFLFLFLDILHYIINPMFYVLFDNVNILSFLFQGIVFFMYVSLNLHVLHL